MRDANFLAENNARHLSLPLILTTADVASSVAALDAGLGAVA